MKSASNLSIEDIFQPHHIGIVSGEVSKKLVHLFFSKAPFMDDETSTQRQLCEQLCLRLH